MAGRTPIIRQILDVTSYYDDSDKSNRTRSIRHGVDFAIEHSIRGAGFASTSLPEAVQLCVS